MLRFTNIDHKPTRLPPVYGYLSHPLLPLRQALDPILSQISELDRFIKIAKTACHFPSEHGLTREESGSIYIYTMEWGKQSLYRILNAALREEDRSVLVPWHGYLKLFDSALRKLPNLRGNLWRGINIDISKNYRGGEDLIWWSFSSCSSAVNVVKRFLGSVSTLFMIEAKNGKHISAYSNYPKENEVILGLGTRLRVVCDPLDHSSMNIVHLIELSDENEKEISSSTASVSINQPIRTVAKATISNQHSTFKVQTYRDGSKYEGDWENEKKHGKGIYYFANGNKYNGDWVNNNMTGQGVYTWPDGSRYEGQFKDDKKNGKGTCYYSNGKKYTGDWVHDQKVGHGVFTWPDGDQYEGQYQGDKKNGNGMYYDADGNKYTGNWVDDQKNGQGVYTWSNGDRYEGQFKNDSFNGKGTCYYFNGNKYTGDWVDGQKAGQGVFVCSNGDRYEGQFQEDEKNGIGKMYFANGQVHVGMWSNDDCID